MTSLRPRDLITPPARALAQDLASRADTTDAAALTAVRRRHPDADPDLVGAMATQVRLRRRAVERLGPWAAALVLDEEALQQATRWDVARYRATRLAHLLGASQPDGAPVTVADVGCGLGIDARALAEAGFHVRAIERDPWRHEAADVNLAAYADRVRVVLGDVLDLDPGLLGACDAAYVDPARRPIAGPRDARGGRSRAESNPDSWSPPWPWVVSLADRIPVVAKAAPGLDTRHVPGGADVEWIDHAGETVEACVWLGALGHGSRRATAVSGERAESLWAPGHVAVGHVAVGHVAVGHVAPGPSPVGPAPVGRWLLEPTPGVVRAGLVTELAERLQARPLGGGPHHISHWLTSDTPTTSLLARSWRVLDEVPHGARALRSWLRGKGSVTWKTVDAGVSAAAWDRSVGHRPGAGEPVTIVITGHDRAFAVARADD